MTEAAPWPSHAYLDALRPDPGWTIETAILATYSADLPSLGAALLALAGRDDERGSGTPADLAESVESLRGRFRLILQRGRLAAPRRALSIAGIFDQFVAERNHDETIGSWHPKIALLQFSAPNTPNLWRLWIGSRNLTAGHNIDVGLTLDGSARRNGRSVPGIPELAERLAEAAALPDCSPRAFAKAAGAVRWRGPSGLEVESVELLKGDGRRALPVFGTRYEEIFVISPFLCPQFLATAAQWGSPQARHTLLSTRTALQEVAATRAETLRKFDLLVADAPVLENRDGAEAESSRADAEDGEPPFLGLHAKLLVARRGKRVDLAVGSANATVRAWSGKNVEVIAHARGGPAVLDGLNYLMGRSRRVALDDLLDCDRQTKSEAEELLERARKAVASAESLALRRNGDRFTLCGLAGLQPLLPRLTLEFSLSTIDRHVRWSGGDELELGDFPLSLQTDLLSIAVSVNGQACRWLQRVPVTPEIDEARDHAALSRHMGLRAFLDWLRSLLQEGVPSPTDDRPWTETPERAPSQGHASAFESLCLEDILLCWARDPKAYRAADERFNRYLKSIREHADGLTNEEAERLEQLGQVWRTVAAALSGRS